MTGRWSRSIGRVRRFGIGVVRVLVPLRRYVRGLPLLPVVLLAVVDGVGVALLAYWGLTHIVHVNGAAAAPIDITELALAAVAGIGGVVALVVTYRRHSVGNSPATFSAGISTCHTHRSSAPTIKQGSCSNIITGLRTAPEPTTTNGTSNIGRTTRRSDRPSCGSSPPVSGAAPNTVGRPTTSISAQRFSRTQTSLKPSSRAQLCSTRRPFPATPTSAKRCSTSPAAGKPRLPTSRSTR